MTDYKPVQKALESGADPQMLCMTCPWDRTCIAPPVMTSAEIDAQLAEATAEDDRKREAALAAGKETPMPVASMLTVIATAGKDTAGQFCPVFAVRLRSSGGRQVADELKAQMQEWEDRS